MITFAGRRVRSWSLERRERTTEMSPAISASESWERMSRIAKGLYVLRPEGEGRRRREWSTDESKDEIMERRRSGRNLICNVQEENRNLKHVPFALS